MISLIVCSRHPAKIAALKSNIITTIGIPFELIVIDNGANLYSIFEAYNLGYAKSKFPILCFMHEDICFETTAWGENVMRHFGEQQLGAIGIAGTPYVPHITGSWWGGELINEHIIVRETGKRNTRSRFALPGSDNKVVILDGVWICLRRELFDTNIRFDEISYKGFHFYDADICMQIFARGFKLRCVYDILIEHESLGNVNQEWIRNAEIFNDKWKKALPAEAFEMNDSVKIRSELSTLKELVRIKFANGINARAIYTSALNLLKPGLFHPFAWKKVLYFNYYLMKYLLSAWKNFTL